MSMMNLFSDKLFGRPVETYGKTYTLPYDEDMDDKKHESVSFSIESFSPEDAEFRNRIKKEALDGQSTFYNSFPSDFIGERKKACMFSKAFCPDTNAWWWQFFLDTISISVITDFVIKMSAIKETDNVLIHAPSSLCQEDAEVIASIIKCCKAKEKWISNPYATDIGSAFLLLAGTKIVSSEAQLICIPSPFLGHVGKYQDARSALDADMIRSERMLNLLKANGFITDEDIKHLFENQGCIAVYGDKLRAIIDEYNLKHK